MLKEKKQKKDIHKDNMHVLDIQEAIDYARCPMLYFFKYKAKSLKTEYINLIEKYDEDIHKVIYYAFTKVQDGNPIEVKDIKASWGKAWIKDKRTASIMFNESLSSKDTYNERRRKGLLSLLHFQKEFNNNPGFPIAINLPYKIPISKNLELTGKFELIRENSLKEIEVFTFKTDEHSNTKVTKENDLKLIASSVAIKKYVKTDNIKHIMYHVDKFNYSIHDNKDLNKDFLIYSIKNIFKSIYNNIFYMGPDSNCFICPYKDVCSNKSKVLQILDMEGIKC